NRIRVSGAAEAAIACADRRAHGADVPGAFHLRVYCGIESLRSSDSTGCGWDACRKDPADGVDRMYRGRGGGIRAGAVDHGRPDYKSQPMGVRLEMGLVRGGTGPEVALHWRAPGSRAISGTDAAVFRWSDRVRAFENASAHVFDRVWGVLDSAAIRQA